MKGVKTMIKGKKEENKAAVDFACEVVRARKFDDGRILFDLSVNGVIIHGMRYIEYVTKEGKEGSMLSFPSYKVEDKWYTHVWFPISRELQSEIEQKITARLGA